MDAGAWRAGAPFGITAYGTEAMHVLRAEKGFVIVGQDTDGTVTPDDLGMGWIVRKDDSDFIGRRSLRRPDPFATDRKQLVGLLPDELLPEGAQLVEEDTGRDPDADDRPRHVVVPPARRSTGRSRSRWSSEGASGPARSVFAPLPDQTIAAEIVSPVFFDPEGTRHDG